MYDLFALEPDVVVALEVGPRTLQAVLLRLMGCRFKLIVQVRESESTARLRGRFRQWLRRIVLPLADLVLVNGESGRRYVRSLYIRDCDIRVVPSGTDLSVFGRTHASFAHERVRRLLYVGSLIELKGILAFVRVLREVCAKVQVHAKISIVGSGPCKSEIEALGNSDFLSIELLGKIRYVELPQIYCGNDVFVMPSLADEWGMVVNEAMASGLPVLGCLGAASVEEMVEHGVSGWVYPAGDLGGMERCIQMMLTSKPDDLRAMSRSAIAKAFEVSDSYTASKLKEAIECV